MRAEIVSYGRHVDSGYKLDEVDMMFTKLLSELEQEDLRMVNPTGYTPINLTFDSHPAAGDYTLRITMMTTEGQEIVIDNVRISFGK